MVWASRTGPSRLKLMTRFLTMHRSILFTTTWAQVATKLGAIKKPVPRCYQKLLFLLKSIDTMQLLGNNFSLFLSTTYWHPKFVSASSATTSSSELMYSSTRSWSSSINTTANTLPLFERTGPLYKCPGIQGRCKRFATSCSSSLKLIAV